MADQNKQTPVKTLCGLALDKESTRYFSKPDGFSLVNCKVCRGIYFDEDWQGQKREETSDQPEQSETVRPLFSNLQVPVNRHSPAEETQDGP